MKTIQTLTIVCILGCQLQAQVSFKLSSSPGVGSGPNSVAAADVNGDGKMDLICANYYGNSLSVLTNNGSGGFVLSGTYPVGNGPNVIVTADVNGDGKVDLICPNSVQDNTLSVLTNNGSGGFVLSGTYPVGAGPLSVVAMDVNGDGKVDLICANSSGNALSVLTNNGSGGFVLASSPVVGSSPSFVTTADVNGDGKMELICANGSGNTLSVLTNNGSGKLVLAGTYPVGNGPYFVAAADVSGDGKVDLITANWAGGGGNTLTVLTNNGSGGFVLASTLIVGSGPRCVATADVNGDGNVDLISANIYGNSLSVLTNNGSGGFVLATNLSGFNVANWVTAADVNGDGRVDLISANGGNMTLSVLTNATPFPPPPIYGSQTLFSDDFNGPQLNPLWVTNLPNVPNAQGSPSETYVGAPSYQFEALGAVPVLRMNTSLPTLERAGWSLNKNFSTTDFRYEVRFNTLTQSSSTSIDGFIEVWVLNSTNFNKYDLVSLFGGYYGTHIFFDAVSSVTGNNIQQDTLGTGTITNNTYYRLVLHGGANQNIRASLCDDLGNELYGYDLGHTTKAYPAGFTIGISQAIGTAGAVYPTDVAIASAVVTTTNILIPHGALATATDISGFVTGATVTDGGYGYTNTPLIRFIGGGGSGAAGFAVVNNGVVVSITMTNAGSGYTNAPLVLIGPPIIPNPVLGIAPMSFLSFSNLTVGGVYQLQKSFQWYWTNQSGSFMASNALYTQMVAGAVGSGNYRLALNPAPTQAFATAQVVDGFVVAATVTSGGSGYVTSPAVTIVGRSVTGAGAYSSISGGVVTSITITNAGYGYTNTVTIQIAPPPAAAVSPTVFPVMRVDSANLAPYYNYQIQFKSDITAPWINWDGGLFSPTDITNSQFIFITNSAGLFRVQYVP